jgi:DNA-binding NtrC family response regulator
LETAPDLLREGGPLLLEWLAARRADDAQRQGLLPALDLLRRGEAPEAGALPTRLDDEHELLLHVLASLAAGRAEALDHYVQSAEGVEDLPALGSDLLQWRAWARLPFGEALRRLGEGLAGGARERLELVAAGWAELAAGRPAEARQRFGDIRRLAARLGLRPLEELAARWEEAARVPAGRPSRHPTESQARQEERQRRREAAFLACHRHGRMLGASPPFLELVRRLDEAARDRLPLLLVGETGTGKELAVEYLHQRACAPGAPLVAVNCGGLSDNLAEAELFGSARGAFTGAVAREGLAAQADGGTLFLDEFGALPAAVQARLLRFLESGVFRPVGEARERRVQVRLVAATCERERLGEGSFRQDLLHRMAGRVVEVPPLARRLEDLPLLARAFLHEAGLPDPRAHPACSPTALARLRLAAWPGNLRQLRHLLLRLAPLSVAQVERELEALPLAGPAPTARPGTGEAPPAEILPLREAVARFEWGQIQAALAAANQDKRLAAKRLEISLPTLYSRLRQAGRPLPVQQA